MIRRVPVQKYLLSSIRQRKLYYSLFYIPKFRLASQIFYGRLYNLFRMMNSKPNAHSRLFAVLHGILTFLFSCKTTTKKDEWSGGHTYDSDVIQVWFPSSKSQSNVQYPEFNLSILKNNKEFYLLFVSWKNCITYFLFPSVMTSANRIALISLRMIILRSVSKKWTVPWFPHLIHLKQKKMRNASTT